MSEQIQNVTWLEVMIDIEGDMPTMKELSIRRKVEKAITAAKIGKCEGTGAGMGMMDMTFRVQDGEVAMGQVEALLNQQFPELKVTLEIVVGEDEEVEAKAGDSILSRIAYVILAIVVIGIFAVSLCQRIL